MYRIIHKSQTAWSTFVVVACVLLYTFNSVSGALSPLDYQETEGEGFEIAPNPDDPLRVALSYPRGVQCPNGTVPVRSTRREFRGIMGCIPQGHKACTVSNRALIIGSCPIDMSCCIHHDQFIGCSIEPERCCFGSMCPQSFACCGNSRTSQCCPLPSGIPAITSASVPFCASSQVTNLCDQDIVAAELTPCISNVTGTGLDPFQSCRSTDECVYGESIPTSYQTLVSGNLSPVLPFDAASTTIYAQGCCPVGTEPCFRPDASLVGCADPALGESCCAMAICPNATRCCTSPSYERVIEFENIGSFTVNQTQRYMCCPDQSDCCVAQNRSFASNNTVSLTNRTTDSLNRAGYFYCGTTYTPPELPVEPNECGMSIQEPFLLGLVRLKRHQVP